MRFILDENLTLGEQRQLIELMQDKGYSNKDISDTIQMIDKDPNQEKQYREILQKEVEKETQPHEQPKEQPEPIQTNSEGTETKQKETQQNIGVKNRVVNYLSDSYPREFKLFLNGIGNKINDQSFPFTRILNNAPIMRKIGIPGSIVESLNEAGVASSIGKFIGNKIAKKEADKNIMLKLVKLYNATLDIDQKLLSEYLDSVDNGGSTILTDVYVSPKIYSYKTEDIKKALIADIAIESMPQSAEKRNKKNDLLNAIKSGDFDLIPEYKRSNAGNESNNEEAVKRVLELAKKNPEFKGKLQKELNK